MRKFRRRTGRSIWEKVIPISPSLVWIPVMEILERGNRTDCIIVASLNNETKEVKMISVYRDTLLDLSDGTLQKCNAAYSYGGPTQAVNMLNLNLDLDIQKYVTVDFRCHCRCD